MSSKAPDASLPTLEARLKAVEEWQAYADERLGDRFRELDRFRERVGALVDDLAANRPPPAPGAAMADGQNGDLQTRVAALEKGWQQLAGAVAQLATWPVRPERQTPLGQVMAAQSGKHPERADLSPGEVAFLQPYLDVLRECGITDYAHDDRYEASEDSFHRLTFVLRRINPETGALLFVGFKVVDLQGKDWRTAGSRIVERHADGAPPEASHVLTAPWRTLRAVATELGYGDRETRISFVLVAGFINGKLALVRSSIADAFPDDGLCLLARDETVHTLNAIKGPSSAVEDFRTRLAEAGGGRALVTIDQGSQRKALREAALYFTEQVDG